MEPLAILILRIGLGITFIFTGYYILKDPIGWAKFIKPWAEKILPLPKESTMRITGYYDLFQGIWFLSGIFIWLAAIVGALHMIQVLVVAGVDQVTYRDIAILFACVALFIATAPPGLLPF